MSFDSPEENRAFAEKREFRFELWTDVDRTLALHYGAATASDAKLARRTTVVLDAEGRQLLLYPGVINVGAHPAAVLEDCQRLFGTTSAD